MSQSSDAPPNAVESKEPETIIEYNVGDYVELQGAKKNTRKGYIRFKGKIKVFGDCVGIELDEKINDGNNGTFNDEQFFQCENGKGTFIKITKIIKKLPMKAIATKITNNNNNNEESFPANPSVISKSEAEQIKDAPKKKKKKKKKKAKTPITTTSNGGIARKGKKSKDFKKAGKKPRKSNGGLTPSKRTPSSSKKKAASKKKEIDFNIPKSGTNKDKLKFVYSRISGVKLPVKKRIKIIQNTIPIIQDEKCDDATAKYAVDGYKKCFVSQLTDRKKSMHIEAFNLLNCIIKSFTKQFKQQIAHYLKHTMSYLEKADNKTCVAAENSIKLIISTCLVKDNKSLGIVIAELIRFGSSAKNKTLRKNGWKFIALVLRRYEPKKGGKTKTKKPPKAILDALQTGLKQGLGDNDKNTQKEAMIVCQSVSLIDETRGERLIARMSPAARRNFDKIIGKKGRSPSMTAPIKPVKMKRKVNKKKAKIDGKTSSKKKIGDKSSKLTRGNSKTGSNKKVNKDSKGTGKKRTTSTGSSLKKKKTAGKKTKTDKTKSTDKGTTSKTTPGKDSKDKDNKDTDTDSKDNKDDTSVKPPDDDDSKTNDKIDDKTTAPITAEKVEPQIKAQAPPQATDDTVTDTTDNTNVTDMDTDASTPTSSMSESSNNEISESTTSEVDYVNAEAEAEAKKNNDRDIIDPIDSLAKEELDTFDVDDADADAEDEDGDDEDDDEDSSDEDSSSSDDPTDGDIIGGQSSENDARDLIESFLDLKDPQINWKMIEFLSKDNMTHLLMSYISRMPQGPKIWQENLDVDFSLIIHATKALFSSETDEIRNTQLSYSLMRILSNEHCAETVKSFLLRKCQEICLHALAVFHPLSSGNVYHGRVVLEILLNHWPKSFMAALANQRHIQSLLKSALFRNLHQGNLNSFFLDLICFRPNTKIGQIQPVKKKLIAMFVEWKFMPYLLSVSTSTQHGDDIATKYATFFIDMVARCASISEAADLFLGYEHLIIDSFMNGLLDDKLTIWHRISCGQTLVQFLDISSRPTIMDPASAMAGMLGVVAPDPMTNILHPMFDKSLQRLHTFIPKMCATITSDNTTPKPIQLASGTIHKPFGQVKLNCLELLTVSADFAQFKCGHVLGLLPMQFWSELLNMAFVHNENNMYLCHFRRLIHLSMIFRRRFLKHLFVNDKLLERFVDFYQNKPSPRTTLHGYILQMLWDIYNHDQRDEDDEDEEAGQQDADADAEEEEEEQRDSVVINEDLPVVNDEDEDEEGNDGDEEEQTGERNNEEDNDSDSKEEKQAENEEFGDDVVLKPNFSKDAEDQWDIVSFFNNNVVWKQFIVTVSVQMEAQNATETQVPNMNVANNQQQLDQLLQNLLGPANDDTSDSTDSDTDSDED